MTPTPAAAAPADRVEIDPAHDVADHAALAALYAAPARRSLTKEADHLTPAYRRFVEAAPFAVLASAGANGLDLSPRGDRGQAVRVLDPRTLALPDRRGNNRIDTLKNLIDDPRLGLIFLIPGKGECLRIRGRARLTTDPVLKAAFAVGAAEPTLIVLIAIERVYFQCARAVIRSEIWSPAAWPDPATLPSAGEMNANPDPDFDVEAYDRELPDRQRATLW